MQTDAELRKLNREALLKYIDEHLGKPEGTRALVELVSRPPRIVIDPNMSEQELAEAIENQTVKSES